MIFTRVYTMNNLSGIVVQAKSLNFANRLFQTQTSARHPFYIVVDSHT